MDVLWDVALWTAIPIVVLLLAGAAGIWRLPRRRPLPEESSQERVAQVYLAAKRRAAARTAENRPA